MVVGVRVSERGIERSPTTTVPKRAVESPASTVPATTSSSALPKPRTVTTLSAEIGPGSAQLVGAVVGPEGPVPGATVRVERFLGDSVTRATVLTDASGQWLLGEINGGRYRVRAWRPPDLTALEATVFFLTATETKNVGLSVGRYGTDNIVASINPDPPVQGQPATLTVTLTTGGVDAEGVLRTVSRPNVPVQLVPGAGLAVDSAAVATDATGNAVFAVRCTQAGTEVAASVVIAGVSSGLQIPACASG